jgi:hypothetical protein
MDVPFSSTPLCTVENRDVCVHYAISFKPRLLVSKNLSRVTISLRRHLRSGIVVGRAEVMRSVVGA